MQILSCSQIRQAELAAFCHGIDAFELMEEAAARISELVLEAYDEPGLCIACAGRGNNGGDALGAARRLVQRGWRVIVRSPAGKDEAGGLLRREWDLLDAAAGEATEQKTLPLPLPRGPVAVIDGLLGSGAHGALRGKIAEICAEINTLRSHSGQVRVWAVDVPTGLNADTGASDPNAVRADCTAAIACVKPGMLEDDAAGFVGRLACVPLPSLGLPESEGEAVLDAELLAPLLAPRPYGLFKNKAGRVDIIAGSVGMTGAARLCAEAALRAGAGLSVLHCPPEIQPVLAAACAPEIMVRPLSNPDAADFSEAQALLIGPGLGRPGAEYIRLLRTLVEEFPGVLTLDADGLNLAAAEGWRMRAGTLLTPHPGEMRRLFPESAGLTRREAALRFIGRSEATLVLKGCRTLIAERGRPLRFNGSGGPAMATAGEGDVLAGVCAGLAAQGLAPFDAASLAAYACGVASELACRTEDGRSLTAGTTLAHLGRAFRRIARREI
ncbi:MAG: NAD(P)H-hydrate dehydratase [Akkermansiaceae bacterium]|nr:NAD(P)H-hydrate dehydratase [Akkermansiaceae bacterium]